MDDQRLKDGTPIADKYFDHLLEKIREIRLSERKFHSRPRDAGGYGRWGVAGEKQRSASSRSEDAPCGAVHMRQRAK